MAGRFQDEPDIPTLVRGLLESAVDELREILAHAEADGNLLAAARARASLKQATAALESLSAT